MICYKHSDSQAVAACVSCGAGLCAGCVQKTAKGKHVCSVECAKSAESMDEAIGLMVARMQRSGRATAWFCWLLGGFFAVLGSISLLTDKFFAVYLLISGAVFIFVGTWYGRISKKASNPGVLPTPASGRG